MSGLSYYIEHFIIHAVCGGIFSEAIKVYGLTLLQLYYWYAL